MDRRGCSSSEIDGMPESPDSQQFPASEWITTGEAARLTGYHPAHIRLLIRRGTLSATKVGRDWLLRRDEVTAYAEKMDDLGAAKHDPWRTGARKRDEEDTEDE